MCIKKNQNCTCIHDSYNLPEGSLVPVVPGWVLSLTHLSLVWSFQFLLESYVDIR